MLFQFTMYQKYVKKWKFLPHFVEKFLEYGTHKTEEDWYDFGNLKLTHVDFYVQ